MGHLSSLKKNKTFQIMSLLAKISLVVFFFCIIFDRSIAYNISQRIEKIFSVNFDFIANEVVLFGRLTFNFSLFVAFGLFGMATSIMFAIIYKFICKKSTDVEEECVNKKYSFKAEKSKNIEVKTIYLLTNKFIC